MIIGIDANWLELKFNDPFGDNLKFWIITLDPINSIALAQPLIHNLLPCFSYG